MACYALGAMAFEKDGDAKAAREAETYFARVEKEFADVKAGKATLGEMAQGSLFELRNLQVGMKAPAAESKNLKDEKVSLADYKGKVVVLDIWATWCGPCRAMIPHTREMVKANEKKPFVFVSVSCGEFSGVVVVEPQRVLPGHPGSPPPLTFAVFTTGFAALAVGVTGITKLVVAFTARPAAIVQVTV
jgi:thiol-disulfide isomerase/thioredoxin